MNFPKLLLTILLACGSLLLARGAQAQRYTCVETNLGEFCMEMLNTDAPATVANFLQYVEDGDFDNTFIHRAVRDFAVQGGGYKLDPLGEAVPADAQIANEFGVSNTRGTVAMAKFANQPDSASTEWFVNLADNSANLDFNNGGYTVFARIVKGMAVVDDIGNSLRVDLTSSLGGSFGEVPVLRRDDEGVGVEDLVQVTRVFTTDTVVPDSEDPAEEETEQEEQFSCTAAWVAQEAPTRVCLDTSQGEICMTLFPDTAPLTVANFLHYVADGDFDNTFFHRSVPGFVVQAGGYRVAPIFSPVATDPAVVNEFGRSNLRGTVAMAKLGGAPDSATSQWFVNLGDNSAPLDTDNEGFTVFAEVDAAGMAVVDQIAALERWDLSPMAPSLSEVPLLRTGSGLSTGDLARIISASLPGVGPNPCLVPKPPALTEYANQRFEVPVRIDGVLYSIIFTRDFASDGYVFNANLLRIRTLVDTGQEAATYTTASGVMVIPSVRVGQSVLTDVRLRLSDPAKLQFTLESFNAPQ